MGRRRARLAAALAAVTALALVAGCTPGGDPHTRRIGGSSAPPVYHAASPSTAPSPVKPNIVFVLTDDLSTDLVRYMPHVRALARRGTSFSNFIVSDSLCCPSRSSIFTGDFPHNTGVFTNDGIDGGFNVFYRRNDARSTFATSLQSVGYRTAFMGKYLNGYQPWFKAAGHSRNYIPPGWNEWDGIGDGYRGFNYTVNEDHTLVWHGSKPSDYATTVLQNRAVQFMKESMRRHSAYMMEIATFTPHSPFVPAPRDLHTFRHVRAPRTPAFNKIPLHAPTWLANQGAIEHYGIRQLDHIARLRAEDVQSIDRMIGTLEQTAAAAGQLQNTVFVFGSDNGLHLGTHRLRDGKLTAFETDIRVPLVVAGPGIPAGQVRKDIAQNIDLAPTFDELAGAPVPPGVDGRSLVPLLHGEHPNWRKYALVEHHGPDFNPHDPDAQTYGQGNPPTYQALRAQTFVFIRYAGGETEYYNLVKDPYELDNIAGSLKPSYVHGLEATLDQMAHCHGSDCWSASSA